MPRAVVVAMSAVVSLAMSIGAQTSQRAGLAEFQGVYAYHGNTTLAIVAADSIVFAVIDEAKYPLRPLGGDRFVNASGDTIPFRRSGDGVISGFVERGVFFARRTSAVDAETAAAVRAVPRSAGPDGRPVAYVYKAPSDRQTEFASARCPKLDSTRLP